MPILPEVGRRSTGMRVIIFTIYTILIVGSVTMVYPFAIMIGSSLTSDFDYLDFAMVPRYIYDDDVLRPKHLANKYSNEYIDSFRAKYEMPILRFDDILNVTDAYDLREYDLEDASFQQRLSDWNEFKSWLPNHYKTIFFYDPYLNGRVQKLFQQHLIEKYDGDLVRLNEALDEQKDYFQDIDIIKARGDGHRWSPEMTPLKREWEAFKEDLNPDFFMTFTAKELYILFLETTYGNIDELNKAWGTDFAFFAQVEFPQAMPARESAEFPVWEEFVRKKWPLRWLRLADDPAPFHAFLAEKYETVDKYNRFHKKEYGQFAEVPFHQTEPEGKEFEDWADYVDNAAPAESLQVLSSEALYVDWLKERYASVAGVNEAYGTSFAAWADVQAPYRQADYAWYVANKDSIRWDFITGNYETVFSFVALKGRALFNTFVLVVGTIVTQLTIMPMAAFALSRFRLSYANKILLFLLATMAFPAEVAMIPNFLLMKEFHMLNTYWALILPGVANGFGVFLLKGFFDSLPDELYEAGTIDGASEWTLFWKITLPLSKPIMAVIGLGAFGAAYGGFMWAFLICQKESMWTLMVFLYQFQQTQSQPVVMASLVVAAIPTLLVFVFCQNIILRGIVIPMAK